MKLSGTFGILSADLHRASGRLFHRHHSSRVRLFLVSRSLGVKYCKGLTISTALLGSMNPTSTHWATLLLGAMRSDMLREIAVKTDYLGFTLRRTAWGLLFFVLGLILLGYKNLTGNCLTPCR